MDGPFLKSKNIMAVSTKKLNRAMDEPEFVNKVYTLSKSFQRIREKYDADVDLLAKRFLKTNCKYKIGDIINIKDAEGGYTQFEIQKIVPHINWEKRTLRVKAYGLVTGEGVEPAEKAIWLDDLNKVPIEPVEPPTL